MTNEEFEERLKELGLTKKRFASMVQMSYGGVVNWGRSNQNIPSWVDSWLDLYKQNRNYRKIKELLKDAGVCEDER